MIIIIIFVIIILSYFIYPTPPPPPLWGFSDNISSMRHCVLSPDETLRRELKMRRAAGFFDELRRTLCRMFDITFQTKWFYKEKLRMHKWAVFHVISKRSY